MAEEDNPLSRKFVMDDSDIVVELGIEVVPALMAKVATLISGEVMAVTDQVVAEVAVAVICQVLAKGPVAVAIFLHAVHENHDCPRVWCCENRLHLFLPSFLMIYVYYTGL